MWKEVAPMTKKSLEIFLCLNIYICLNGPLKHAHVLQCTQAVILRMNCNANVFIGFSSIWIYREWKESSSARTAVIRTAKSCK